MKGSHLVIGLSTCLILFFAIYSSGNTTPETSRNEIVLRKIGHELLRSAGDDTSRVLPIQKISEHEFQIRFENELALSPDSIVSIVNKSLTASTLPGNYTVNIVECSGKEIFYGYAMSASGKDDLLTCSGRALPRGCYYIDLKFSEEKTFPLKTISIVSAFALAALLGIVLSKRKKKIIEPQIDVPEESVMEENTPQPDIKNIAIGQFNFNSHQHYLELHGIKTILTNKESQLLRIFAASINEIIDRNTLQKEVWENEGVIVTRSLDMFVSKLRKKLQADEGVRIVNFPGKGYMLEVSAS